MRTTIMFPGREYWKSAVFWNDAKCSHCREPFVIGGDYWQTKVQNPNHVVSVPPLAYHDHCMVDHLLMECHFYKGCYGDMLSEMIRAQYEADKWKGNHDNVVRLNRELQSRPPRNEVKHDLKTQAETIKRLHDALTKISELETERAVDFAIQAGQIADEALHPITAPTEPKV